MRIQIPNHNYLRLLALAGAATLVLLHTKITFAEPTFATQSSSINLEWDFDFVETFDGLDNWRPDPNDGEGNVGEGANDTVKMPQITGGGVGPWRYYSVWNGVAPPQDWIGDYGDQRVWRGSKSLTIDIGETNKGPSRFGLYFFNGYEDFYLFFMVNIPKNEWPTTNGSPGVYNDGSPYAWFSSWKFLTFNMGCQYEHCWEDGKGYSPVWHQITHLKQYNYGDAPGITFHVEDPGHISDVWSLDSGKNLDSYGSNALGLIGEWFGVEYHIRQTASQTIHETWVYDQYGKTYKVLNPTAWSTPLAAQGKKWDFFFFGGNNSGTYSWGPTMQSAYYIDDVIFDNQRIGPKYFELIKGQSTPWNLLLFLPSAIIKR